MRGRTLLLAVVTCLCFTGGRSCQGGGGGGSRGGSGSSSGSGSGSQSGSGSNGGSGGGDPAPPPAPPPEPPAEPTLADVFGGDVEGADLVPAADAGEAATDAAQLSCDFAAPCGWSNEATGDALKFGEVKGQPDPGRWAQATGTDVLPDDPFYMVGSDKAAPDTDGQLLSKPIVCQNSEATFSFRHWRSVSEPPGNEPQIQVCTKLEGSDELQDCLDVVEEDPGPSVFTLPPKEGPFQIVIRAYNFVNEFGGFVALDDIVYEGDVSAETPCSGGSDAACAALACDFRKGPCEWNPVGPGATGPGVDGWRITNGLQNENANALTGVKANQHNDIYTPFALAEVPDPAKEGVVPELRYVMHSTPVTFAEPAFVHFWRKIPVYGMQLSMCKDADGIDCFYNSQEGEFTPDWTEEIVELPAGEEFEVFIIAQHDDQQKYNAGQVAFSGLELYKDATLAEPLCT